MITIPAELEKATKSGNLDGLRPYALLYRNKWDSVNNVFALENTPIDISDMIVKPNTLSMTLDVNEIAQYNANNVTLTLSDKNNKFIEGVPDSYFPDGYQLYGSKVVLYYGFDTPLNPQTSQVGYTVVGSPTITDGVASGFSASDYLQTSLVFPNNLAYNNCEYQVKFTMPATALTNNANILKIYFRGTADGLIVTTSNKIETFIGGQSNVLVSAANFLQLGQTYVARVVITSTMVYLYCGPDENNLFLVASQEKVAFTNSTPQKSLIGRGYLDTTSFTGSIDLKETYIKVNGQMWFNGAAFFYNPITTPIFTGIIKDLPTHKPEKYQVDIKLVSPLERLKDIEAKDFSDKYTGEVLTLDHTGDNNEEYYKTSQTGVGGITALYANGVKLYEGVDYNVENLNDFALPATIEVVNSTYFGQTFTADYFIWKRGLLLEQVVEGLANLGGYTSANEDIQPVIWQNAVRNPPTISPVVASIGYYESDADEYTFNLNNTLNNSWRDARNDFTRQQIFCKNFDFSFKFSFENTPTSGSSGRDNYISFGDAIGTGYGVQNGFSIVENLYVPPLNPPANRIRHRIYKIANNTPTLIYELEETLSVIIEGQIVRNTIKDYRIEQRNGTVTIYQNDTLFATITSAETDLNYIVCKRDSADITITNQIWNFYDDNLTLIGANLSRPCIVTETLDKTTLGIAWGAVQADIGTLDGQTYFLTAYFSNDGTTWSEGVSYNLDTNMARTERYLYYIFGISNDPGQNFDITDPSVYYYAQSLFLNLVNLGTRSVLEALQDLSLISGYEFGVDRQGVFFFRPRLASTTPIYELDHSEIVKVDTVKKNLNDFFTKLTLTFAEIPLEVYANEGTRPTPIDKYGVINKDIDKPDIVNYDNPELAQAIGPQLLAIYSALPDTIQATGKLNLALELGDIVNLKRNYPLTADPAGSDYDKFERQNTYYRACKITGLNYNFAKRQITYTLRDVSDSNNQPSNFEITEFVYDFPIEL